MSVLRCLNRLYNSELEVYVNDMISNFLPIKLAILSIFNLTLRIHKQNGTHELTIVCFSAVVFIECFIIYKCISNGIGGFLQTVHALASNTTCLYLSQMM